jgi:hypothetical protein
MLSRLVSSAGASRFKLAGCGLELGTCFSDFFRAGLTRGLILRGFFRQKKQYGDSPDTEDRACRGPEILRPAVVAGDYTAKDRIERMDQNRCAKQRRGLNLRSDKYKAGEISYDLINIHCCA